MTSKHTGFFLRLLVFMILLNLACGASSLPQPTLAPATSAATTVVSTPTRIPTWTPKVSPTPLPSATPRPAEPTSTPLELSPTPLELSPTPLPPLSTPLVGASPTPPEGAGIVLPYLDDFELLTGWFTGTTNLYMMEFLEGGYHMVAKVATGDAPIYSVREQYFDNIQVGIDVMRADGPDGTYMGIVCRFVDPNNLYRFVVDVDGYYEIAKKVDGEFTVIESGSGRNVFLINKPNHIQASCMGAKLTLTVNGKQLLEVHDGALLTGKVGLIVGANYEARADVLFDNFQLSQP